MDLNYNNVTLSVALIIENRESRTKNYSFVIKKRVKTGVCFAQGIPCTYLPELLHIMECGVRSAKCGVVDVFDLWVKNFIKQCSKHTFTHNNP